jgi:hypothetical protein
LVKAIAQIYSAVVYFDEGSAADERIATQRLPQRSVAAGNHKKKTAIIAVFFN